MTNYAKRIYIMHVLTEFKYIKVFTECFKWIFERNKNKHLSSMLRKLKKTLILVTPSNKSAILNQKIRD